MKKILCSLSGVVILFLGFGLGILYVKHVFSSLPPAGFHEHADFAVFLNGKKLDLTSSEFMTDKPCTVLWDGFRGLIQPAFAHEAEGLISEYSDYLHLHSNIDTVMHVHKAGATYGQFFQSLGMILDDDYFQDHDGVKYQVDSEHDLRFFIDNQEVETLKDVAVRDLQRTLITYGAKNRTKASIDAELVQITSDACISSGSCEHRGFTPAESCGNQAILPSLLYWFGLKDKQFYH